MLPVVAIYILWLFWLLSWLAAALGRSHSDSALTAAQNIVYSIVVIIAGLLLFGVTPAPGWDVQYRLWMSPRGTLGWLAAGLTFSAFCVAWWATICRALRRPGPVVQSGPYKVIRHPIYASLTVASLATATMLGRPSSLVGAMVLLFAFIARVFVEEHTLREESTDYDEYTARVPMLVPFLPMRDWTARPNETSFLAVEQPTPFAAQSPEPATLPLFDESPPVTAAHIRPEKPAEDQELPAEIDLELRLDTTNPLQLSLLLDEPDRSSKGQPADRETPHGPLSSELKPTSAA